MQSKFERLIGAAYKRWKSACGKAGLEHIDEEAMLCFAEGRLAAGEEERVKLHLIACDRCLEAFVIQSKLGPDAMEDVPEELIRRVEGFSLPQDKAGLLEIALRFRERLIEVLNATGDVLMGQELVPAVVLRSRQSADFKDQVIILKDFQHIKIEVKVENKSGGLFDLSVVAKDKHTDRVMKDLRITIKKDDLELESRLTDAGSVTFEHFILGKYTIDISSPDNRLASILLDIKA